MPIANEYNYYTAANGTTDMAGSFAYWADPIVDYDTSTSAPVGDSTTKLVAQSGLAPPAPWVSYTRAGCDFGSVAGATTELENTTPDVPLVFGATSPEPRRPRTPTQDKAAADFEGLAVHCARAPRSAHHHSVADLLPSEPGGYPGYQALFGSKYVHPLPSPAGPVQNLDGAVIKDSSGDIGFPGYDGMTGPNALAYTLDMQLHGVPVTYTYLTDLHDSWTTGASFGPSQATYERSCCRRTPRSARSSLASPARHHPGKHAVRGHRRRGRPLRRRPAHPGDCNGVHPCAPPRSTARSTAT